MSEAGEALDSRIVRLEERQEGCRKEREAIERSIFKALGNIERKQDKILYSLNGNGEPGLKAKIEGMTHDISTLMRFKNAALYGGSGSGIVAAVYAIWEAVQ